MLAILFVTLGLASADITGTSPPNGACLCVTTDSLNIRSSACGTVVGSASKGQCFTYRGSKTSCAISGTTYEFFSITFGGATRWTAGKYLDRASSSSCSSGSVSVGYTCSISDSGKRIHETTTSTPYDCRNTACGNTCKGGQCVAYVTCRCKKPGTTKHPPSTSCWRPGTKVVKSDGTCNSAIPANTAIATFRGSSYYAGHAAVFIGCASSKSIRVYDQGCCKSIGYSTYSNSHSHYNNFYVLQKSSSCSDRTSWPCRSQTAGSTCCPVSAPGCKSPSTWWDPLDLQEVTDDLSE